MTRCEDTVDAGPVHPQPARDLNLADTCSGQLHCYEFGYGVGVTACVRAPRQSASSAAAT
jgi:hypothetical protein